MSEHRRFFRLELSDFDPREKAENGPDVRRWWFRLPLAKLVLFNSVAMILCSCFYSSAGPLQLILLLSQAWMAEVWEAVEELEDLR